MGTKWKDKLKLEFDPEFIDDILKAIDSRKDPKGKAKHTKVHRDRTKYTRKRKHKEIDQ